MPPVNYIHLRTHSEYSLKDSLNAIDDLIGAAKSTQMPALALTDHANLFAAIKFYEAAVKAGIKPIIGADIWLDNTKEAKQPFRLTLLCQNHIGYQHLLKLVSKSYLEGQTHNQPLVQYRWLKDHTDGLIALSGAHMGDIGHALLTQQWQLAQQRLTDWVKLFPDRFYIELSQLGQNHEAAYLPAAILLAKNSQIPVVATNEVCFIQPDDFEAHETRICIHAGVTLNDPRRTKIYTEQQYFRSPSDMQQKFAHLPEALSNTVEIAKRCNLQLELGKTYLPEFPVPESVSIGNYLAQKSHEGLNYRLAQFPIHVNQNALYQERLKTELSVINNMGFSGYFLIVADFVSWAKKQGIFVGPGRGSGVGSLVAYALGITNLDPIPYDLLFERFLNPERVSMPDFDIDFCMDHRDRVIDYVAEKYGRESVSQIITFGTMAAKAVIRDVGRVLGHPYGFVDKIAKLIPFEIGMTLEKALNQEAQLATWYQQDEEVKNLIDLAKKLEGLARNAGKHAGGVVIAPSPLTDFSPLYCEANEPHIVTQFDKDDIEKVGLIKFDFLGLRTLTIMDWTLQMVNKENIQQGKAVINIEAIPLDDEATFDTLRACATTAVFQLESRGMKDLVKRLQPDCFEEIIALVALFRPGPLQSGMVDDFVDRKHGRASIEYLHPTLESILKPTYGVILYQEQVMKIAQVLAEYTLGEADLLRRAMGKKKPEEMAAQQAKFVQGAKKQGIPEKLAKQIFSLMEKFAGYGFNKSHAAAYALLTYQTAWLKTHYPAQFMAAVLSSDMDKTDKVVRFYRECQAMKLTLLPPNINEGQYRFTVNSNNEIVYGLGAIKGVGQAAVENMVQIRQATPYRDLFDFCQRVDLHKVNKRSLEALIQAGAMDQLGSHRATLLASLEKAMTYAEQTKANQRSGTLDVFSKMTTSFNLWVESVPWTNHEQIQREKIYTGLYFSGHPLDHYTMELTQLGATPIADLKLDQNQSLIIAGQITQLRFMQTKRGQTIAFITVEDRNGAIDVALFADILDTVREFVVKDQLVLIDGTLSVDETGSYRLSGRRLLPIEKAREQGIKRLLVCLQDGQHILSLKEILTPYCGGACPVWLEYQTDTAQAMIPLGLSWRVYPKDELLTHLRTLLGSEAVVLNY